MKSGPCRNAAGPGFRFAVSKAGRASIASVVAGGPADGALLPGDEIVAVDGVDCRSFALQSTVFDRISRLPDAVGSRQGRRKRRKTSSRQQAGGGSPPVRCHTICNHTPDGSEWTPVTVAGSTSSAAGSPRSGSTLMVMPRAASPALQKAPSSSEHLLRDSSSSKHLKPGSASPRQLLSSDIGWRAVSCPHACM